MKKDSYFEGWGYSDSMRLLVKGETKNRNEFVNEFKKTYPKSKFEKTGQKGVELYVNEGELPYIKKLVKIFNLKVAYNDGGKTESQEIARTILNQLGGQGRLIAMTGAYNFIALKNGVSFKIKNRKVNYIKITLNGNDLYDVVFGKIISYNLKVLSEHNDVYFDELIPLFEKQTGMYLKLFKEGGMTDVDDNLNELLFENGGYMPKKLIYVLYGVKDQADSLLNANGTRNRGWWRSDLPRNESDELLKKLKERKLILEAIIYIGDSTNIKFDLGGAIDDDEEDLFENYDKLPIRVQKIIADFSEDDNTYEDAKRLIAKLNKVGYTCEYGLDAEPYGLRKLSPNEKFAKGGGISRIKNGDVFNIILNTNYGIKIEPYRAIVKVVDDEVNSRGQVTILHIEGKMKGTKTDIQVSKLKNQFAEGGMPQGMSIADANPYIAGAKTIKGIAPESFSAVDKKLASRINPDPYRPVFFKTGGKTKN